LTVAPNKKSVQKVPSYDQKVYEKAFELYNKINPGIFKIGKINGDIVTLIRTCAHECLMSGKIHENENAFCRIKKGTEFYSVYFGCFRFCHRFKSILIGHLSIDNLILFVDEKFRAKRTRRRKNPNLNIQSYNSLSNYKSNS